MTSSRLFLPLYGWTAAVSALVAFDVDWAKANDTKLSGKMNELSMDVQSRTQTPEIHSDKMLLSNGLELIVHEDHRNPLVSISLYYHVGSKDEEPLRSGFAHLFEHLLFRGSKHVEHFDKYLEQVGATDVNASTNKDLTRYYETLPSNQLELALWLESDRMGFLLDRVNQLALDTERDIVKNENFQRYGNQPYGKIRHFIDEAIYPKTHPYHRSTIGTPEDLDRATLSDVHRFFRTFYVPNNASLVIAGDVTKEKVVKLTQKYFEPIPRGDKTSEKILRSREAPKPITLTKPLHLKAEANVELNRIYLAWPTPPFFGQGDAELDLVSQVLSSNRMGRLYKRLVVRERVAQDVSAFNSSSQYGSLFYIVLSVAKGRTMSEALTLLDDELQLLRKDGVTEDELGYAKSSTFASNVFSLESVGIRADRINTYNHFVNDPNYFKQDSMRYLGAQKKQVDDALRTYLREHERLVLFVESRPEAPVCGKLLSQNLNAEKDTAGVKK